MLFVNKLKQLHDEKEKTLLRFKSFFFKEQLLKKKTDAKGENIRSGLAICHCDS